MMHTDRVAELEKRLEELERLVGIGMPDDTGTRLTTRLDSLERWRTHEYEKGWNE